MKDTHFFMLALGIAVGGGICAALMFFAAQPEIPSCQTPVIMPTAVTR